MIRTMTIEQTADYLENARIEQTIENGWTVIHIGVSEVGHRFVLTNDCYGGTVVTED